MPDELTTAIATALATSCVQALAAGSGSALAALGRLVRHRFGAGTPEAATLEDAVVHPDEHETHVRLGEALALVMAADPPFAERVRSLWDQVMSQRPVDHGAVANQFSGQAGKVVQVRDIHGDVTL